MDLDRRRLDISWPAIHRPFPRHTSYLAAYLASLLLIILMTGFHYWGQLASQRRAANAHTVEQAQVRISVAHLWLEECLLSDDRSSLAEIEKGFATVDSHLAAMLEGGMVGNVPVPPLRNAGRRGKVESLRTQLADLRELTARRVEAGSVAIAGSPADEEYDAAFLAFEQTAEDLTGELITLIARHNAEYRVIQLVLAILVAVSVFISLRLFILYYRRISRDFKTISQVGEELNAANAELKSTNDELYSTNEELEAQYAELEQAHNELRRAQEEQLAAESQLSQIVQSAPMGLLFYELMDDDRLVLRRVNEATSRILGVDCGQLVGLTIEEAFPPLAGTEIPQCYRAAARDGVLYQDDQVFYNDGRIAGAYEIWAFQTEPDHMAVYFQDITDRLKAVEEIRDLRLLLTDIIDSMPSALVTLDAALRVNHWNHSAEEFTGVTAGDATGRPLVEILPQVEPEIAGITQVMAAQEPVTRHKLKVAFNGTSRLADLTIYPLRHADGVVLRLDDVTERVRIEELMIQSEKMVSVGGLAAGMAHEINNPLAGILQNAQVLENRLTKADPANTEAARQAGFSLEQLTGYADRRSLPAIIKAIRTSGVHASQIVNNMLNFSRKSDSQLTLINLVDLVRETVELARSDYDLKKQYDFRRIAINEEFEAERIEVKCERTKIQQVLLNLLKNGAEAMIETQVERPPEFTIRLSDGAGQTRVEIEDNGPGISEENLGRVFEPFFTTKQSEGTGLGLSISYFIITKNHGGTMEVSPVPGGGTRFAFTLPHREEVNG